MSYTGNLIYNQNHRISTKYLLPAQSMCDLPRLKTETPPHNNDNSLTW